MTTQIAPANQKNSRNYFSIIEILFIILLALVPLFVTFPYRVNIFLSWEGAYRLSQGEIPYRDFGMPLGYMYWVVPAIFFKIFGAQLITLVKAQVFLNIISGLAFRSILKNFGMPSGVRLLSVLVYCVSFSFFNFWPWYNHTVIIYEMVALAFLTRYLFRSGHWMWISLSALFAFFSFFTKQDGGGLAILLCLALLVTHALQVRQWKPLLIFVSSLVIVGFAIIAPLTRYDFGYWFNHGQPPHTARVSVPDLMDEFFGASSILKFYVVLMALILVARLRDRRSFFADRKEVMFTLLTLGILAEAAILQVTSYTPPDNNIFFHSFAFAWLLWQLSRLLTIDFSRLRPLVVVGMAVLLWWSGVFWKYVQRIIQRGGREQVSRSGTNENVVNRHTYMIAPPTDEVPLSDWTFSGLHAFEKIYMPRPTVEGIHRLLAAPDVKSGRLHVLNMTELTPLAVEMPYTLDKGRGIPLWYHLGVGMFNKEAKMYGDKIAAGSYDLVMYEYIPRLNNFYPFSLRDSLRIYYEKTDSFPAPRRGDPQGVIEVYRKKTLK